MHKYNRQSAIEYAQRWALASNPDFYHFGGIGGDCTNFISQCLLAGGAKMNYERYKGWFYENSNYRSPSWTSVKYLQEFLLENKSPGIFAQTSTLHNLQVGDLIQLRQNPNIDFNHTVIITKISGGEIYVCAHSYDVLNKPLSKYVFDEALGIHIVGLNY